MPSVIVFDLDDTLYPERGYVLSGFMAVARWAAERFEVDQEHCFRELSELFDGGDRGRVFDDWIAVRAPDRQPLVPEMIIAYRTHDPEIQPYPGIEPMLERLRRTHRLALLSDGTAPIQRRKFARLCLGRFFEEVLFTDDLGRSSWKPSPTPFRQLLERMGVRGPDAVYVADNPTKDFRGPRRVGMRSVRVRFPEGLYRDLEPASAEDAPDAEVESLEGLELALRRLQPVVDGSRDVPTVWRSERA